MPESVAHRLRRGEPLDDAEFDRLYPEWAQRLSKVHWTPVGIARRAAELLVVRPGQRILDVGAGVGKLCLVGSLCTTGVFYGIEQRARFVIAARVAAARLGVGRARFLHGNMMSLDWRAFEGFYLYNPFAENVRCQSDPLDDTVELDICLLDQYVRFVRLQLHHAAPGTRVVTFHGFGGELSPAYELTWAECTGGDQLELFVKTR